MARLIPLLLSAALLALAASVGAEPLQGRLFFSADERDKLDQIRQKSGGASPTATDHVTLSGLVRRSGGKATVWINQAPQHEDETPSGIAVPDSAGGVPLRLPSGKTVKLKVGQTLDITKGNIREGYESADDSSRPVVPAAEK